MKTSLFSVGLAVALFAASAGVAITFAAGGNAGIEPLAFLAGNWKADKWGGQFHAYYTTNQGGKVISYSELRKEGKVTFYEFEVFDVQDGKLSFTPFPAGKRSATFSATTVAKNKVVFDQPEKDFPTRLTYELKGKDLLVITLADPHHKSDKTDVFELKRVDP